MIAKVTYNYHISLIFCIKPCSTFMLVASLFGATTFSCFGSTRAHTSTRYIISSCDSVAEHTIDADYGASACIQTTNTRYWSVQHRSSEPNSHLEKCSLNRSDEQTCGNTECSCRTDGSSLFDLHRTSRTRNKSAKVTDVKPRCADDRLTVRQRHYKTLD